MKQDIREHSDSELSLLVFNDEYLYNLRRNTRRLMDAVNSLYIYSDEQLTELESDLIADLAEEFE